MVQQFTDHSLCIMEQTKTAWIRTLERSSTIHSDTLRVGVVTPATTADLVAAGFTPALEIKQKMFVVERGRKARYEIITFRGCCELSSRNDFLFSNSSAVG